MKVLHLDSNHPALQADLEALGYENHEDFSSSKQEVLEKIKDYQGIVIRSRFKIEKDFLDQAKHLRFIARVGAGLENIDVTYAKSLGIEVLSAAQGNANAVAEHTLGMLLSLMNNFRTAFGQVQQGQWLRESNRGEELDGKVVGIIGYGVMGKAFARKLKGFDVDILCYDILPDMSDDYAKQVSFSEFCKKVDIVSLHTPLTPKTIKMVDQEFIKRFEKPFWFLNTARGQSVVTKDLLKALKQNRIKGAGLDVLEYESISFESIFSEIEKGSDNQDLRDLISLSNVIVTPHIAGWTVESKLKLSNIIVNKIRTIKNL